jgi:two-component system phosphate regulon sensor histidine kinase PhoR
MLVEERGRLTAVMDNMADGVVITDGDGHVRLINPAAARILGAKEETAMGRSFAEVARDHRIIDLWQQCREDCEELIELVDVGHDRPFLQVIVTPLRDAEPGANLVMLQDLTQVRRLETVRRDFISNISHELRTPLASLKALADTLHDGALEDPPAARRFLERMEVEVDALVQMVQELLELSRIESGQVGFEIAPVSVDDVVRPPVERLRPQAERADLRLSIDLAPDLPPMLADAERVQQVITNLVHNAIKFTPPGGAVAVSARAEEDEVIISVRDTGVGIPADDLPRIFERFYKADRARSGGGTGLGLAIAKHIVLAHGGRIWAESVEGRGSTFSVALPVQAR